MDFRWTRNWAEGDGHGTGLKACHAQDNYGCDQTNNEKSSSKKVVDLGGKLEAKIRTEWKI